jgi:hypothetical protein
MLRKEDYLRSNLLASIQNASLSQLKKVRRKSNRPKDALSSFKNALEKTRMANTGGEDDGEDDSDDWDD